MMKVFLLIFFTSFFFTLFFSSNISNFISKKLTYNINKNLEVDWGVNSPVYSKENVLVHFDNLSITWEKFKIILPELGESNIVNKFRNIDSRFCSLTISIKIDLNLNINCETIKLNHKDFNWETYKNVNIETSSFFQIKYFDQIYEKQKYFTINIFIKNLFLNNLKFKDFIINYNFVDKNKLMFVLDGIKYSINKNYEGILIKNEKKSFFILNQNFFQNYKALGIP